MDIRVYTKQGSKASVPIGSTLGIRLSTIWRVYTLKNLWKYMSKEELGQVVIALIDIAISTVIKGLVIACCIKYLFY